jgi:hypothetical protein
MSELFLSKQDVLDIPDELLPMPVLSDCLRSLFGAGIKIHTSGAYNHFMWLISKGVLASQNYIFQKQPVSDYFKKYRLKFWYCHSWTPDERKKIIDAITSDLNKSWYKRLYDPVAILGQAIYCDFIQLPFIDICSDKGDYLSLVDPSYDLFHPDPEDVNRWLEKSGKYQVYGRYVPD